MSESYLDLRDQLNELTAKAEQARKAEVNAVIAEVRRLVLEYQLAPRDIFGTGAAKPRRQMLEAKFRNPETGATWCGRGRPPLWLVGKDRDQYLIAKDSTKRRSEPSASSLDALMFNLRNVPHE
ncbi:H-NS family nucleoid-associated regulatory protein [Burkholderia territorii]|uniref:H-NS histone family protein n=1 Tax=Burkholderia territorii TaxID=1503055 RepID=UPI0009BED7FE|nr:H-NS histone family protein [Burkholderia territorii]